MNAFAIRVVLGAAVFSVIFADSPNAQTSAVWPLTYASQPGEAGQAAPFSISGARSRRSSRSVTTFIGASLPFRSGSVITGIAYRRDATYPATYNAYAGECKVYIGSVPDAKQPSQTLRYIWDGSSSFASKGPINVPAAAPPAPGAAAPFNLSIPFLQPWTYPGRDMGIDVRFEGPSGSSWVRDAVQVFDGRDATVLPLGYGCTGSNSHEPYTFVYPEYAVPGGGIVFELMGAPASDPTGVAILALGRTLDTPIDLGRIGMPSGCTAFVDPLATHTVTTGDQSTQGYSRALTLQRIPANNALIGARIGSQWFVPDPNLSARLPLTVSNALSVQIGVAPTTRSTDYGYTLWSHGDSTSTARGMLLSPLNHVAVTQFTGTLLQ